MSRDFSSIQQRLRDRIQEVQSFKRIEEESATLADSLEKLGDNTDILLVGGQGEIQRSAANLALIEAGSGREGSGELAECIQSFTAGSK